MHPLARCALVLGLAFLCTASSAQEEKKKPERRFGFDVDQETFPQKTPEEAMKSIAKALNRDKVDYLLAHLADPGYVDYWVDQYKVVYKEGKEAGKRLLAFDRLVRETNLYFENDPLIVKDLRAFAKDAKWTEDEGLATGVVESIPARKVTLKKVGERWYLKNEQQ